MNTTLKVKFPEITDVEALGSCSFQIHKGTENTCIAVPPPPLVFRF